MRYLAIDKTAYVISYAVFDDIRLKSWGTMQIGGKSENERLLEIKGHINYLIDEYKPTTVITHLLDLSHVNKLEIERIVQVKTIIRLTCIEHKPTIMYYEFRTYGWELRITNKRVLNGREASPSAKIKIAQEYDKLIKDIHVANAVILGEGVAHTRLQIGRD